jgi:hypothetical protein
MGVLLAVKIILPEEWQTRSQLPILVEMLGLL